jgi:hypothetical protein
MTERTLQRQLLRWLANRHLALVLSMQNSRETSEKRAGKISVVGKDDGKNRQHRYFSTDKQRLSLQNGREGIRHSEVMA